MEGNRIMQGATDLIGFEMPLQFIAARVAHHVKMVNTFRVIRFDWQLQRCAGKQFMVARQLAVQPNILHRKTQLLQQMIFALP